MPFNVMIQLCRVTRASKLFQRNFYLPLLKPLSPKDALRRHIITGKNLLGQRIEHYIPVLEEYSARIQRRKYMVKGLGKKRQRKKASMKYVMPFFDEEMEGHAELRGTISRKSKGRGQCYTYFVPDKNCTLVIPHQFERAIRDKDILDVVMAQRSEKIVVKLKNDKKVTLPLVAYDGNAPFYSGEGWTRKEVEEYHHHGKETMSLAKLFEAKEQGVEEWELEMMRLANKRKKKHKGEGTQDWKQMMAAAADNMDWDKFEEDCKQIVDEVKDPVEDEPIAMEVDDMAKTKNVNEKLMAAGPEVLEKLPLMGEIPECVKLMPDGNFTEIAEVSGVTLTLNSNGKERFVAGQMVKGEEGDIFMPGQTIQNEEGNFEYTPGFTIMMDGEATLLPGLVMGDDPNKPMFLPGESTITESGELQFTETEADRDPNYVTPPPEPEPQPDNEEEEIEEEEEEEEPVKPPPKPRPKPPEYKVPRREIKEPEGIKRREKAPKKKLPVPEAPPPEETKVKVQTETKVYDMSTVQLEKDTIEQEKERVKKLTEKKNVEERSINIKRREIIQKAKQLLKDIPPAKYVPLEPVKKSEKLAEWEQSIKKGNFFEVDHKRFINKDLKRHRKVNWKEPFAFQEVIESVGINRTKVWRPVY
ncbi:triadin-like [Onthophagus taurus]|uniref:triadin-like n=1 Tax=Onthophagus taurus TaxID=166361 RepID=UPI0039BE82CC